MNAFDEQEQGPGAAPGAEEDQSQAGSSILDQVKQKRVEAQEPHYTDIDIPGYEGLLVARYQVVEFKVFEAAEKRIKKDKSGPKMLLMAIDQIINCCDQILVLDPGHPACVENDKGEKTDLRPIDPVAAEQGAPVKWEPRLAKLLDIPESEYLGQARLVVKAVFGNEPAIVQHSTKVGLWLKDTSRDIDDVFLGE